MATEWQYGPYRNKREKEEAERTGREPLGVRLENGCLGIVVLLMLIPLAFC